MSVIDYTKSSLILTSWVLLDKEEASAKPKTHFSPVKSMREWLDGIEVNDRELAHTLCKLIPAQCPFERDIKFFGRTLFHIPPMCKLNPLYEQLVTLRFKALCYLADRCGEDVTNYC